MARVRSDLSGYGGGMAFNIRSASVLDIPKASATLADAFESYPWTRWSIPADGYKKRLERLQAIYLAHAMEHGFVLVSESIDGVAAILPARCPEPHPSLREGIAELMGERMGVVFGVQLPPRPTDSWDLATLGVAKSSAGQGLGSALIEECLRRAASLDVPRISLETSASQNVELYERNGFVVLHQTAIKDGPLVYSMSVDLG